MEEQTHVTEICFSSMVLIIFYIPGYLFESIQNNQCISFLYGY